MARFEMQIVSKKELKTLCGIPYSPAHIARLEAAGQFPKRIRLGQNRVGWMLSEVEAWISWSRRLLTHSRLQVAQGGMTAKTRSAVT